ncbi:MAG: response regulator [Saprospiraceae bacterium]|nr:response regulator [Saprospiraceae bacterium]
MSYKLLIAYVHTNPKPELHDLVYQACKEQSVDLTEIADIRDFSDAFVEQNQVVLLQGEAFQSKPFNARDYPGLGLVLLFEEVDEKAIRLGLQLGAEQCLDYTAFAERAGAHIQSMFAVMSERGFSIPPNDALEHKRLAEIDMLKTEFFTNISHELRTPLTVIKGMADQIEADPENWLDRGVNLIRKNTDDLLDLVNQILDLHKLESGNMKTNWVQRDIVPYLSYIAEVFQPLAHQAGLAFEYEESVSSLIMDVDQEKLQRVLFNLLSNAIKFTPSGGKVGLRIFVEEEHLVLVVWDTGIGIRREILDRIFDRFFQAKENFHNVKIGTGIGLALVRELISLMGGSIEVTSAPEEGSDFRLLLPIHQESKPVGQDIDLSAISVPVIEREIKYSLENSPVQKDLPRVLVVEDSPDIAEYLTACLEEYYQVSTAPNGQEGLDAAIEHVPDLVISDVMMPRMTGLEFCTRLKTDTRTSHIPVVLLTAKADEVSRIEGLQTGADAYLTKPFNRQELLVRLGKLHQLRQTLRERYQSLEHLLEERTSTNLEDSFMAKLYREVLDHAENPDYGVHELCRGMALSRTQLHRKIKALTDRSTTSFIRWVRLSRARQLIVKSDQRISEIAYHVGFSDPKYFSRSYAKEFGHSPREEKRIIS